MSYGTVRSSLVSPKRRTSKTAFFGPQLVKQRRGVAPIQLLQVGTGFVRPNQGQQFVPSIAIGSMATIVTIGGRLVGGGGSGRIVILTGSEEVEPPELSVASAVSVWTPTRALLQTMVQSSFEIVVGPGTR